jgi:adenylate cyclase class IV
MKPINLQSPLWAAFLKYLGWILLFLVLWFKGCSGSTPSTQIAKVIVPEVKGSFQAKKPVHEPIVINANNTANMQKGETIYKENPIDKKLIAENEKLKSDYAKANDSIKQLSFNKAIQLNKFSTKFEDENLVLNINGVVQGEVKEISPNYTIKEKKVEVPVKVKETVFRILGGLEVGNNTKLDNFKVKANLMFQNRKGNIISGSFDTNQTVWVGYNVSIFDIKR